MRRAARQGSAPPLAREPRAIAVHAPLLLLLALLPPVVLALAVVGALVVLVTRARPVVAAWHAHRLVPAGQVVLALVALAALPGFLPTVADVLRRG